MAAHNKETLYPATVIATDTTTTGDAVNIKVHANEVLALATVSSRTDGTFTVTIEHSADGTNWHTWKAGSAQSANGTEQIYVTDSKPIMSWVRASILSASTTSGATVAVQLLFGNQR